MDIKFLLSAYKLEHLPKKSFPEVILCGRSNVGKSSFINSVFNKKGLAKTSNTPGKTRSLNYYAVEEKFYLVDLPGYGFAKGNIKEKENWQKFIAKYLASDRNIALAFHLIDSRHKPTQLDILLNEYLHEYEIPTIVILNKVDKLNQSELSKSKKNVLATFNELIFGENLLLHSALKGVGVKEIKSRLKKLF